jgi:hypothetical protein
MAFSNYLDGKILDHLFGATTYTAPATLYFGLSTTTIYPDGSGITEPVANAYTRVAVANNTTNFPAGVDSFTGVSPTAVVRAATTAYSLTNNVFPATANGHYYTCTTAGTTGGSLPTYPTVENGTVTDGTVVWTAHAVPGQQKTNGTAITFPASTGSWGTITNWFVSDASSAGNILAHGVLSSSQTVGTSNTVSFNTSPAGLTIQQQ